VPPSERLTVTGIFLKDRLLGLSAFKRVVKISVQFALRSILYVCANMTRRSNGERSWRRVRTNVGDRKNSMRENARNGDESPPSTARFVGRIGGARGGVVSVRWTGVDGHSTIGRVGAFFGTCRPTKQVSSPSDSGHKPVSGMTANNDNNILTNDKSCGTVSQLMRACLRMKSDCDDARTSGASAEWTRCKPIPSLTSARRS